MTASDVLERTSSKLACYAAMARHRTNLIDLDVARGVVTLGAGEILARSIAFVGTAILTRRLGPDGFGVLAFAMAVCGYFALTINAGLGEVGAREVARDPARASPIYVSVAAARILLGLLSFALLLGLVAYLPKPDFVKTVVILTALSFVSLAFDPLWLYRALERRAAAAAGQVMMQVIYVAAVFALIDGPEDLAIAPVAQFTGEIVVALALAVPFMGGIRAWRPVSSWRILQSGGYLSVARVLRTVIVSFDILYLGFAASSAAVGLYTASYRIAFLLMAIAGAASAAFLPSMVRAHQQGLEATALRLSESLRTALYIGAPLVVGGAVTAGPLLTAAFGSPFQAARPVLVMHMAAMGCFFVHAMFSNLFLVTHRTGLQARIYAFAAALNVTANIILIPRFGIAGAAAATLLAEAAIAVLALHSGRSVIGIQFRAAPMLKPIGLACVMGIAVALAKDAIALPWQILLGGCIYCAGLAIFYALSHARSRQVE